MSEPSPPPVADRAGEPSVAELFWGRTPPRPTLAAGVADRLRSWRADPRLGVAALILVAAVAGVVWYRTGLGSPSAAVPEGPPPGVPASGAAPDVAADPTVASSTTAATAGPAVLVVHVAGAVLRPGVVELPAGSRVIDAVEAVGGGLPEADLDRLNLAAPLADGQRVLVAKVGDPPTPADPVPPAAGAAPAAERVPVDLNTATQEELESLPGIGPTLARAILDEREKRGGFRSVNELRDVRGIGEQRFADLRGLVTV